MQTLFACYRDRVAIFRWQLVWWKFSSVHLYTNTVRHKSVILIFAAASNSETWRRGGSLVFALVFSLPSLLSSSGSLSGSSILAVEFLESKQGLSQLVFWIQNLEFTSTWVWMGPKFTMLKLGILTNHWCFLFMDFQNSGFPGDTRSSTSKRITEL